MATNDGQRLTIFGLTYRQHDNRSMLRILREYSQPPENPGDRTALFVALSSLAKELDDEKSETIANWLRSGASASDFPSPNPANLDHDFGRGPSTTAPLPGQNQPNYPLYPGAGYPFAPEQGRAPRPLGGGRPVRGLPGLPRPNGNVGGGRGPAFPGMEPPGFPGMGMEDFMGGIHSGRRSAAFMGVGRSLVDSDSLAPEFPTANAPIATASRSSINEDVTMSGDLEDMSAEGFQHRQHHTFGMNPFDSRTGQNRDVTPGEAKVDRDDDKGEDEEEDEDHEAGTGNEEQERTQRAGTTTHENNWDSDEEDTDDSLDDTPPVLHRRTQRHHPIPRGGQGGATAGGIAIAPEAPKPESYLDCCVCAESLPPTAFPPSPRLTTECQHPDEDGLVCLQCLEQTIRAPVDDGILNLVLCPMCPAKLSIETIKKYASERIFARYQYLLMSLNPDMVFCLAPGCGHCQVHTKDLGPMMSCQKCTYKICAHHKLPWHEDMTCDEFDCDESQIERLEQEEATAKLLASLASKICPTCKQGVDRTDGCDHLRCRCGGEWCFHCLASWENILRIGMEAHAPTCVNHPRRVQMRADQKTANEAKILESVHGGKISETLQKARHERNVRNREKIRPLALEAAEKRAKEEAIARRAEEEKQGTAKKQKKARLLPAWEER